MGYAQSATATPAVWASTIWAAGRRTPGRVRTARGSRQGIGGWIMGFFSLRIVLRFWLALARALDLALMESGQDVRRKIYQTKRHCIFEFIISNFSFDQRQIQWQLATGLELAGALLPYQWAVGICVIIQMMILNTRRTCRITQAPPVLQALADSSWNLERNVTEVVQFFSFSSSFLITSSPCYTYLLLSQIWGSIS